MDKQKNTLLIIFMLIILTLYYNSFYSPNAQRIAQRKGELTLMQTNMLNAQMKVSSLESLQNSCITSEKKIALLKEIMPRDIDELEKKVVDLASQSALKIKNLSPEKGDDTEFLHNKSVRLNMEGSFESFYQFAGKLENTYKTASISRLTLSPGQKNMLNISCLISYATLKEDIK